MKLFLSHLVTECEKGEREKLSLSGSWLERMLDPFTEMRNAGEALEGR